MKKVKLVCICMALMLIVLTGCQPARENRDIAAQEETGKPISASSIERLVNHTFREYFGKHKLYCCDDGFTDGRYVATVYGDDDRIEFFIEYDTKNKVLLSTASEAYHRDAIYEVVSNLIEETTWVERNDEYEATETYDIRVNSEMSEYVIEDYDEFISEEGTEVDIIVVFDKLIKDTEEEQIQNLVEELQAQHIKGELTYCGHEEFSKDIEF